MVRIQNLNIKNENIIRSFPQKTLLLPIVNILINPAVHSFDLIKYECQ